MADDKQPRARRSSKAAGSEQPAPKSERTLAATVFLPNAYSVNDDVYPAGTAESDIPAEHVKRITNPRAWQG